MERIDEAFRRFRNAMVVCFAAAVFVLASVVNARHAVSEGTLQQLASLGVAFWLVAIVLMFFTAYYRSRRRLISSR